MKRYNVEVTIQCRTPKEAREIEEFMFFSGFLPMVEGNTLTIIAKGVDAMALEYMTMSIEDDDRVVSSSFHRTPF